MAELNHEFVILGTECRTCFVKKRRALFHRWIDRAYTVGDSPLKDGAPGGQIWEVLALVEYEDGTVGMAYPHEIKFKGRKLQESCWREDTENETSHRK